MPPRRQHKEFAPDKSKSMVTGRVLRYISTSTMMLGRSSRSASLSDPQKKKLTRRSLLCINTLFGLFVHSIKLFAAHCIMPAKQAGKADRGRTLVSGRTCWLHARGETERAVSKAPTAVVVRMARLVATTLVGDLVGALC